MVTARLRIRVECTDSFVESVSRHSQPRIRWVESLSKAKRSDGDDDACGGPEDAFNGPLRCIDDLRVELVREGDDDIVADANGDASRLRDRRDDLGYPRCA